MLSWATSAIFFLAAERADVSIHVFTLRKDTVIPDGQDGIAPGSGTGRLRGERSPPSLTRTGRRQNPES